ncbi:PASTA domain-containing protein [Dactylosporangium sp. CS-033363]|uniref:PASTA domain-containing protein n=1 Tax=Dactylosporangium sp. CS-033363 TaxID=3239935 RepID=UPI003D89C8F0
MPFRSARTVIRNTTGNYKLTLTFSHLCNGEWTPGGWEPPAEIRPGQTGGMQSESDGVLQGTEGYAKYDVTFGVLRLGMIYVYWTNPTAGVTRPRFAVHRVDVLPHCDYDNPDGDSVFYAMDQTVDFHLAPIRFFHTDSGGDIVRPGDLAAAFTAGPIGGIAWLAGLTNIYSDAGWEYELRQGAYGSTSSPLTPHGTTTTTVPVTEPLPPPPTTTVPDLTGLTAAEAVTLLAQAGLHQVWFYQYSEAPKGTVIAQDVAAGSEWPPGSPVGVTLSEGPDPDPGHIEDPIDPLKGLYPDEH